MNTIDYPPLFVDLRDNIIGIRHSSVATTNTVESYWSQESNF